MMPLSEEYLQIREYLLGILSGNARREVEERLLTEQGFLDELQVAEDELIDDYVSDELSADNRSKFEEHFLCTTERQQKLRFASALSRYIVEYPERAAKQAQVIPDEDRPSTLSWGERFTLFWNRQAPAFRFAAAVCLIALVVPITWTLIRRSYPPPTIALVTLSISAGDRAEGVAPTAVKLTQEFDALKVTLKLPVPARGYRVELMDTQGATRPVEIVGKEAQALTLMIPAKMLVPGEYALRLYVVNSDGSEQRVNGSYFFLIE